MTRALLATCKCGAPTTVAARVDLAICKPCDASNRRGVLHIARAVALVDFDLALLLVRAAGLLLLVTWIAPGCGSVEIAADGGALLELDGAAADAHGVKAEAGGAVGEVASPAEAPPSCSSACAACAPYPCAAVVACVRAGDAGAYPWQSCHNVAGGGADAAGLACAQRAASSCSP